MIKLNYLVLFVSLIFFGCKKQEAVDIDKGKTVNLVIKGLVMTDTLEFAVNNKVIGQAIGNDFKMSGNLFTTTTQIQIRKKTDRKTIGNIDLTETPYDQVRKIFFDGTTISNNLDLTPVKDKINMGFRLRFSTTFADFYGGPVDIEIFEAATLRMAPRTTTYKSITVIKNVTGAFSDFIEVPPFVIETTLTKSYKFKIYKAGTTDLPYKSLEHVSIPNVTTNYGTLPSFIAGGSLLISISPQVTTDGILSTGYQVVDFSADFR